MIEPRTLYSARTPEYVAKRAAYYRLRELGQCVSGSVQYVESPWAEGYFDEQFREMRRCLDVLLTPKPEAQP